MDELIPSPYAMPEGNIVHEMRALFAKYGYTEWGFFAAMPLNIDENMWTGYSNVISEGMVEQLETTLDWMKEKLEEEAE